MKDQLILFTSMMISFVIGFFAYPAAIWLNDFFHIDFWFTYCFRQKALKRDENFLWSLNNQELEIWKYKSMKKKTLRAKLYLAALKALNEVNDYEA